MSDRTLRYEGWLVQASNGEEYDLLGLSPTLEWPGRYDGALILAEELADEIAGKRVTVRYLSPAERLSWDEARERLGRVLMGAADAEYAPRYSDITGYLWTDEELNVGGHDLLRELKGQLGRYLLLEIVVHGDN